MRSWKASSSGQSAGRVGRTEQDDGKRMEEVEKEKEEMWVEGERDARCDVKLAFGSSLQRGG